MLMKTFQLFLFTLLMVLVSCRITVKCEHQRGEWKTRKFYLTDREVVVPTIYGLDLVVDDSDGMVSRDIKKDGWWEPRNIRAMARLVKEGDTILNVGAHVGIEAVVLGRGIGPKGKVFAFEPTELTYPMLAKNFYLNNMEDYAVAYKMGAGNAYSKGISTVYTSNTGASRINVDPNFIPSATNSDMNFYEVVVDRVDNVLPKGTVVDFALIDTESMEIYVLQGMKEVIARSPNLIIACEWWGWYFTENKEYEKRKLLDETVRSMGKRGFKFYRLSDQKGNCDDIEFIEMSLDFVLSHQITFYDIFYVPQHIDPNKL